MCVRVDFVQSPPRQRAEHGRACADYCASADRVRVDCARTTSDGQTRRTGEREKNGSSSGQVVPDTRPISARSGPEKSPLRSRDVPATTRASPTIPNVQAVGYLVWRGIWTMVGRTMDGRTRGPIAEARAAELAEHYARILGRQADLRVSAVVRTCLRRLPARLPIRGGERRAVEALIERVLRLGDVGSPNLVGSTSQIDADIARLLGEAAGDPRGVYRALRAMLGRTALVVRHSRQIWELRLAGLADAASEVHRALVAETPALYCLPTPDAVLAEPAAAGQAETPSPVSQVAPPGGPFGRTARRARPNSRRADGRAPGASRGGPAAKGRRGRAGSAAPSPRRGTPGARGGGAASAGDRPRAGGGSTGAGWYPPGAGSRRGQASGVVRGPANPGGGDLPRGAYARPQPR
jgi:hypothetical protein